MGKWNQARHRGGRYRIKKLRRSRSSCICLNPRLKNEIFMLPSSIDAFTANNPLKVVNRVHTIYTLRLPHYKVSISIGICLSFLRFAMAKLDAGSRYNIVCFSMFLLDSQRHVCPDYGIHPVEDANGNLLQICQLWCYAHDLEALSTKLSFWLQIDSVWKYSWELDLWMTTSTLFDVSNDKWNSLMARYRSLQAPQTNLT